jgi:Histidine kinase-, DNA gyrase B-, and HSP90-like ATPase
MCPLALKPTLVRGNMEIVIPNKFKTIIEQNSRLAGSLTTLVSKFSDWIAVNNTEFFPEYTDHGIDHVQSVLNTAEEIIENRAWSILSAEDIYVLVSAILLHDCAMHLSREGLWNLISKNLYNGVLLGFDNEEEWLVRWTNFTSKVRRYDESDYTKFFGEYRSIEIPVRGSSSLDDNQKIILGDFVREYHACIAQVIATYGIPCKDGPYQLFDSEFSYLNQMAGFVARSHNHGLREAVDLLGEERKRAHRNMHPSFIMGVLRISDYLQLKSDRTPKILFSTLGFCSPISINEWKKHLSIISTHDFHPDDELIFIEAFPDDAITLVGIKKLLIGLQKELDEFWAVIGEVYSRFESLKSLAITYRRVKSNIDNSHEYVDRNYKDYYPEVLSVRADDQKLFPLLIKPLYGDLPQIGLRELLQNAIDACNERYGLECEGEVNEQFIPYKVFVTLNFEDNSLTIKDEGVGMDPETITDYFLKVGSSYRMSEYWKAKYTTENDVFIPRTGKFGIGMLAGFLIGNEIEVHTKLATKENVPSVSFKYKLESQDIELKLSKISEIGTTIKISSTPENLAEIKDNFTVLAPRNYGFHYDQKIRSIWYFLDSPTIETKIISADGVDTLSNRHCRKKTDIFENWNKVIDSSLEGFFWRRNVDFPCLLCNGILIPKAESPKVVFKHALGQLIFDDMEICIFDNKGSFPLSLTRNTLNTDTYFEHEKLEKSFKGKFIAELLGLPANHESIRKTVAKIEEVFDQPRARNQFIPVTISKGELLPFACKKSNNCIVIDFISSPQKRGLAYCNNCIDVLTDVDYAFYSKVEKQTDIIIRSIGHLILNEAHTSSRWIESSPLEIKTKGWVFVRKYDYDKLGLDDLSLIKNNELTVQPLNSKWVVISRAQAVEETPHIGIELMENAMDSVFIFAIIQVIEGVDSDFSDIWNRVKSIEKNAI